MAVVQHTERTGTTPAGAPGPVRAVLRQGAVVAIVVVLMGWSLLGAARITSPSMQPTVLGDACHDVRDLVLIDTMRYALTDPGRWELVSFRAPLHARETFLKRLVGLPGERIAIAGGNVHLVDDANGGRTLRVLRRPAELVEAQWLDVYPGRTLARGEQPRLAVDWTAEPGTAWREQDGCCVAALRSDTLAALQWNDVDGGLVDRPWDGLPAPLSRRVREVMLPRSFTADVVGDARIEVELRAEDQLTGLVVALDVRRPDRPVVRYGLELTDDHVLLVVRRDGARVAASAPVPRRLAAGERCRLAFAHVDDELVAWWNGIEVARCEVAAFALHDGGELPDTCGMGPAMPGPQQRADVRLELRGRGEVAVCAVRVWRDRHWTRGPLPEGAVLEVPAGHYLLLGDDARRSEDGRGMRTFAVGDLDGRAVPADTPGCVVRRGGFAAGDAQLPPERLENPVLLPGRGGMVVGDEFGNQRFLRGDVSLDAQRLVLHHGDAAGARREHDLLAEAPQFVPRSALGGRVVARVWPLPPFGPWWPGWLR